MVAKRVGAFCFCGPNIKSGTFDNGLHHLPYGSYDITILVLGGKPFLWVVSGFAPEMASDVVALCDRSRPWQHWRSR